MNEVAELMREFIGRRVESDVLTVALLSEYDRKLWPALKAASATIDEGLKKKIPRERIKALLYGAVDKETGTAQRETGTMQGVVQLLSDTLDRAKDITHTHHYKYVQPTDEAEAVEDATREHLAEWYSELGEVRWYACCEKHEADFSKAQPILGFFDADTGELAVRADVERYKMIETLLHEFEHSRQAKVYGAEKMKEGSKPDGSGYYCLYHELERKADDFALKHLSRVQWKVSCRLQDLAKVA